MQEQELLDLAYQATQLKSSTAARRLHLLITRARKAAGLQVQEFARMAHAQPFVVERFELGRPVSWIHLHAILRALLREPLARAVLLDQPQAEGEAP